MRIMLKPHRVCFTQLETTSVEVLQVFWVGLILDGLIFIALFMTNKNILRSTYILYFIHWKRQQTVPINLRLPNFFEIVYG